MSQVVQLILNLPPWLTIIAGVFLLLRGADWLVEGAVAVARRMGVSTLVIGLTIVAAGTSAPELAVNIAAAIDGSTGISFGNVVGSNIANIGLVIGLGAIVAPFHVHGRIVKKELPWLLVVSIASAGMAFLTLTQVGNATGRVHTGFSRLDGWLLVGAFLLFLVVWFRLGRADARDPMIREAQEQAVGAAGGSLPKAWGQLLVGLAGLVAGGKLTELGAVGLAHWLGVSDALIGMTVVAVATSLPEVFTVIAAARQDQADLAVGNVVGSNVFNLLLVLGVTAAIHPVVLPENGGIDLLVMIGMTVVLWIVAATNHRYVNRPNGTLLLVLWAAYLGWRTWGDLG